MPALNSEARALTSIRQLHPWHQQREVVAYCNEHKIVLQAFSPLVMGDNMQDKTLLEMASRYDKSPAQVLIRYSLQKGWVPLPRSEKEKRIKENTDVFDFELSDEDMTILDALELSK